MNTWPNGVGSVTSTINCETMVRRRQDIIEAKITAQIEYLPTAGSSLLPLRKLRSVFILFCELAFSIVLPMIGLLVYMTYAEANAIKLEVGCHGPGVPFSMLSGILFIFIQRLKHSPSKNK